MNSFDDAATPSCTAANLTLRTATALRTSFDAFNHTLTPAQWAALTDAIDTMTAMATGAAHPLTYVSALDPGVGKTQALTHWTRELLKTPELSHVSLLVCAPRLEQIKDFAAQAGLSKADFAVLTADKDVSALSETAPNDGRVLIITHAMFEKRGKGRLLSIVPDFFYHGEPRTARIWDESLLPGRPLTVARDDISDLFKPLRFRFPALVNDLETLFNEIRTAPDGTTLWIPDLAEKHDVDIFAAKEPLKSLTDGKAATIDDLWFLFGKTVTVRRDGTYGNTVLDYKDTLPADACPILVMDASARVRTLYRHWELDRGKLVFLKKAEKFYSRTRLHVWSTGGGRGRFSDRYEAIVRFDGIAQAVLTKPDQEWLIIHHLINSPEEHVKARALDIQEELKKRLPPETFARVKFLTWGRHTATNAFVHIPNIILAGTQYKRTSHYEAIHRVGRGYPSSAGPVEPPERQLTELGENLHEILQAVCRGSIRRCEDGEAPESDVYLMAAERTGLRKALAGVFRGAEMLDWNLGLKPLRSGSNAAKALLYLEHETRGQSAVTFSSVLRGIGMADTKDGRKNFKSRVRDDEGFKEHLKAVGWMEQAGRFIRM